jgi:hypothetical protein
MKTKAGLIEVKIDLSQAPNADIIHQRTEDFIAEYARRLTSQKTRLLCVSMTGGHSSRGRIMTTALLELQHKIERHLEQIERLFPADYRVTLVVRNPASTEEEVFLTQDNPDAVIQVIERMKPREIVSDTRNENR